MEKVATDIYTFEKLRKNGFTYVDKTDVLYAMASGDVGSQFFIARLTPRLGGLSRGLSPNFLAPARGVRVGERSQSVNWRSSS